MDLPAIRHRVLLGFAVLALLLLVAFVAVNFQEVEIDFLVVDANVQLAFALILSAILGFLVGLFMSSSRRG